MLIFWWFAGAFAFLGLTAEPRYSGIFEKNLGHASEVELLRAATETLVVVTIVGITGSFTLEPGPLGWQDRAIVFVLGSIVCYVAIVFRAVR